MSHPVLKSQVPVVQTRFGDMAYVPQDRMTFPQGLLGFGECREFVSLRVPAVLGDDFLLLQCLENKDLAFVMRRAEPETWSGAELDGAVQELAMDRAHLEIYTLVTLHRDAEGKTVATANLRAPLFVDARDKMAHQYVFLNGAYGLKTPLI